MLKRIAVITILVIILLVSDCNTKFYHDKTMNPCSGKTKEDSLLCNQWKTKFPKEYEHYQRRLKTDVVNE